MPAESELIKQIHIKQQLKQLPKSNIPPLHNPEMLYIGCVDARLDPVADIGIPQGKALIYRNIGALVFKETKHTRQKLDTNAILSSGEIPENVSMGAALEFFINVIPAPLDKDGKPKIKDIVISGHTDCGGMKACLDGCDQFIYLPQYIIPPLREVREKVVNDPALPTRDEKLRALEEASVRQSIANLMSYDIVRKAVEEGRLQLHGWVINTATQRLSEMDEHGHFHSMSEHKGQGQGR